MPTYYSSVFSTSNEYIKYQIIVTETGTNISNNTSSVNVIVQAWRTNYYTTDGHGYCVVFIDGVRYVSEWQYGDGHAISHESYTLMFEQNLTIAHNADGKKSINVSAYFDHVKFSSNEQGFTVNLTDIPRQANITGATNFSDNQNPTITYSNPAGNVVTSLQACISANNSTATVAYRDVNKTGSSYTFNLTQAERNALLATTPNSNSKTVYFILKTVIGGNTYYSSKAVIMSVVNANPTISAVNYADTNGTTTAITSNNQWIIQANSTVRFTMPTLTALKGSSLTSVKISLNGQVFNKALSGTTASNTYIDVGTIDSSENLNATVTLTDSRGNTTTATKTITMLAWKLPTGINSLYRRSNYYSESYIKVDGSMSSLNNLNVMTIQYRYKERGSDTWGAWVTISDNTTYTLNLDNTKSFDFQTKVTDRLGATTYNLALQIGIPILYVDKMLRSVGVGTLPNEVNMLAVDRRLQIKNLDQNVVADLWSWANGTKKSCSLYLYNESSKILVTLGGREYGGSLYLNNLDDKNRVLLNVSSFDRGNLYLRDENSTIRALIYGDGIGQFFNSSGTATITETGQTGNITCISLTQTSSRKVKDNIKPLTSEEANKVLLLEAVTFDYKAKEQGVDRRGFIAEEVKEVIPQVVTDETGDSPATLDYIELIPYLQAVVKEQAKTIKDLQERIEALEKKLQN